jgi:hypothetical protein
MNQLDITLQFLDCAQKKDTKRFDVIGVVV